MGPTARPVWRDSESSLWRPPRVKREWHELMRAEIDESVTVKLKRCRLWDLEEGWPLGRKIRNRSAPS